MYAICIVYALLYYMRVIFCRHMFIVCSSSQPGGCCTGPTRRGVDKWTRRVDEWTTLTGCSCHVASDLSKGSQISYHFKYIKYTSNHFVELWFCQAETAIGVIPESRSCGKLSVGLPGYTGSFLNENPGFGDLMEYCSLDSLAGLHTIAVLGVLHRSGRHLWLQNRGRDFPAVSEIFHIFILSCHFVSCISTRLHVLPSFCSGVGPRCPWSMSLSQSWCGSVASTMIHHLANCQLMLYVVQYVVQCCSIFMKMFQWCEIYLLVEICWSKISVSCILDLTIFSYFSLLADDWWSGAATWFLGGERRKLRIFMEALRCEKSSCNFSTSFFPRNSLRKLGEVDLGKRPSVSFRLDTFHQVRLK